MKIRKFIAYSMPEAMQQIKDELGTDAIILNSKEVKPSGLFGFLRKKKIEVTAMLDKDVTRKQKNLDKNRTIERNNLRQHIHSSDHQLVLREIKHLQKLLMKQPLHSADEYPPMLEMIYQYMIEQDVKTDISREIIEKIVAAIDEESLDRETIDQLLYETIEKTFANHIVNG